MPHDFHHPPGTLDFWRRLVTPLLGQQATPFYLFSSQPVATALAELDRHFDHLPVRHWLSFKTQPLRPLLAWWRERGLPVEVVSEFEFLAALREGFPPESILVNGPAKHHWLPRHPVRGLGVNFDSSAEVRALAAAAQQFGWTVGVRLNTAEEVDPEHPDYPTQFGMTGEELAEALPVLRGVGVEPAIVHFHLRTNVASPAVYERALAQAADLCDAAGLAPRVLDVGGGFPVPHVLTRGGKALDAAFCLRELAAVYERALKRFPSVHELWLENGRWLSARSGVLVVRVLDVKERRGMRNLICDGGRAMNALVSTWENHELLWLPERTGSECLTTVNGPTCMAWDQLARRSLPRAVQPGDYGVWLDAGAYHLPWETRFSHGLAAVLWHDEQGIRVVRERENFEDWWGGWQ
jgi:diaminopimelate decarboxylase